ncbi:MAG: iron-sulfur cluster assembly protein [Methanocellales archaeon]
MDRKEILDILKKVYDPEHPISVLDLKIVEAEDISIEGDKARIEFKPTSPFCPMGGLIGVVIKYALEKKLGKEVEVRVKKGTHAQEKLLNDMLEDKKKYEAMLARLKPSGLLEQCIEA